MTPSSVATSEVVIVIVLVSLLTPCKGRNSVAVSHPTLTHRELQAEAIRRDADEARADAQELLRLRSELTHELQEVLPAQARQLYLSHRLRQVAAAINEQYQEYERLSAEVRDAGDALSVEVRDVIESDLKPEWEVRRTRTRLLGTAAAALFLLSLTPYNLYELLVAYFETLGYADFYFATGITLTLFLGCVVVAATASFVVALARTRWRLPELSARQWPMTLAGLVIVGGAAIALGFVARSHAEFMASEAVCGYEPADNPSDSEYVCADAFVSPDRARTIAGVGFNVGVVALGGAMAATDSRYRRRLRRQRV